MFYVFFHSTSSTIISQPSLFTNNNFLVASFRFWGMTLPHLFLEKGNAKKKFKYRLVNFCWNISIKTHISNHKPLWESFTTNRQDNNIIYHGICLPELIIGFVKRWPIHVLESHSSWTVFTPVSKPNYSSSALFASYIAFGT